MSSYIKATPSDTWVIFDMDGTIWDAMDQVVEAWKEVYARYPEYELHADYDQILGLMGQPVDRFKEAILGNAPEPLASRIFQESLDVENQLIEDEGAYLYPYAIETIKELKAAGYHIAIVSNSHAGYIEVFIKHYGLADYVEDHICYGDNHILKADNLRMMVKKHQMKSYVYVGDTQGDHDSCMEAGVPFVWVSYGFGKIDRPVDTIDSLKDLQSFLEK